MRDIGERWGVYEKAHTNNYLGIVYEQTDDGIVNVCSCAGAKTEDDVIDYFTHNGIDILNIEYKE